MKIALRILILTVSVWALNSHCAENKPLPKWVLTHSMGMMPATSWWGGNGLFPLNKFALSRPPEYFTRIYGGQYRMLPLSFMHCFTGKDGKYSFNQNYMYPPGRANHSIKPEYLANRYLWDLQWAERMGIDGFGILLSQNNKVCKKHAEAWFNTMEEIIRKNPKTNLRVTLMFSGHELPDAKHPERFRWMKEFCRKYKNSPAWLRHSGRVVLMGYRSMMTWDMMDGLDIKQAKKAVKANSDFIKSLGLDDPMFIFDGTEYVPGDITHRHIKPDPRLLAPIAKEVCKTFDGYMVWGGVIPDEVYERNYPVIAGTVNKSGKAWGMPIINIHSGIGQFYISKPGVERLIDTWKYAHKTNAQLAQIVTWNDSNEATCFVPGASVNYAFSSLNAKFIYRFKHGKFPEAKEDSVYMFYRKYHPDADPYLYPRATVERDRNKWGRTDDMLHVIIFAKASGKVKISGTSKGAVELPLKKGYNEFKLKTAVNKEIAVRIYRDGKLDHKLISPERVTDRPFREDLIPWGWSSDCRKYYDMDFNKNFRPISYYSQRYNDGIPDWFRLFYFGSTELPAGGLPHEDPDKDGIDNLHEYLLGENPTIPNPFYEPGYKWDELPKALAKAVDQRFSARINFNPYPDKNGKLVHTFMYKIDGKLDGSYLHMNKWNNKTVGWSLRNWKPFRYYLTKDKGLGMDLLPGYAGIYRFWSPVAGKIKFKCTLKGDTKKPVKFYIKKGAKELFAATCDPGKTISRELELYTALRDRIDFIVKTIGDDKATITMYPEISMIEADNKIYSKLKKIKAKDKSKMKKTKKVLTTAALGLALTAGAGELAFDFNGTGSDRQAYFGSHYPLGRFDYNYKSDSFQVQGGDLKCITKQQAWILFNDVDPMKNNKSTSKDAEKLKANDFTARTMFSGLSSGDGNVAGSAGFLIGVKSPGKATTNGYLCLVDRVPGANKGTLHIDKFAASKRTDNVAKGKSFKYGNTGVVYFLQLKVTGKKCQLSLFADKAIPGKGRDSERLKNKEFATAKPVAELSFELPEYKGGYVGLFFEDTGHGGRDGGVRFKNFYLKK